jgi:uncharacterized protein (TIGR03032 family)
MAEAEPKAPTEPVVETSPGFESWLLENQCALAMTLPGASRLFFAGLSGQGTLWLHQRHLQKCQALCASPHALWLSTLYQIWNFQNALPEDTVYRGNDADHYYCPRVSYVTGAIDAHDMALGGDGVPIFANTLYSCLSRPTRDASFEPVWTPSFITKLAPEDRCHLNGLADVDGDPRFVTVRARSDSARGWKRDQARSGLVISVHDNEFVSYGLALPHSPRLYRDQLWLLNTGSCEFVRVDLDTGYFEPVCFCPGYARGLSFVGDYAVIGLSLPRNDDGFAGQPLAPVLERRAVQPMCGILIVDLNTAETVHWLRFRHTIREIANVVPLAGVRQPFMLGFKDESACAGEIHLPNTA